MTTVQNPLNCKNIGLVFIIGFSLAPETGSIIVRFWWNCKRPQSGKLPGRETGRRNGRETVSFKLPQSGKLREGSGKRNGKGETDFEKTCSPGRSGKVLGRFPGRDVSIASPILNSFLSVSMTPDFPNPDHVSIS